MVVSQAELMNSDLFRKRMDQEKRRTTFIANKVGIPEQQLDKLTTLSRSQEIPKTNKYDSPSIFELLKIMFSKSVFLQASKYKYQYGTVTKNDMVTIMRYESFLILFITYQPLLLFLYMLFVIIFDIYRKVTGTKTKLESLYLSLLTIPLFILSIILFYFISLKLNIEPFMV